MNGGSGRDRILKDVNGNISDHLQNHIHLTNCIHLKNHVHKHSSMLADRALIRDLVVLQRSRSLRDPSASPNSWHSSSAVETLLRRGQKDASDNGRRNDGESTAVIDRGGNDCGGAKIEESNGRFRDGSGLEHQILHPRPSKSRERKSDGHDDGYDALSCNNDVHHARVAKVAEEKRSSARTSINRGKRRKFRSGRRNRPSISTREAEAKKEISVASNSFAQGRDSPHRYYDVDHNVSGVPKNGCGLPFNWSRIHHRGKSIIDMAGRSLSCGLSEPKLRKEGSFSQCSSSKSDEDSFPLLPDASQSDGSINPADFLHDYSGELRIFAKNLLNQEEVDFDLASEGRSREHVRFQRKRHQNLTQKYMPRTFRDIVGQNLVIQALSNAITKRKVGLLYVFYGPHGTGKTTCARIFAKALNCHSLEGSKKPCGFCDSCIAHEMGKSRNVKEISPVSNIDLDSVIELFETMIGSSSQHQVFIFDECDNLSSECWSSLLKVIERAPRRVIFILVCSSVDVLPHIIISRCQKFFFPKLKDADIMYTLQKIASKEDLEIDKDALKLIASRSEGSLRDAEMTLEQLSLLGERISLCLVQELVGLISEEKLVDLLDLALSADTVNTVKNLRDIMESGVEPLALMSQLATVITDILAGSYDMMKERPRRKFFRHPALTRKDMEKLRRALKTLSEAEKQLRVSNDRTTWLTAALLQLAPDQNYMLSSSSADSSLNHSPLFLNNSVSREKTRTSNAEMHNSKIHKDKVEEIWLEVLEKIPINSIKEFMYKEGKLMSLSYGTASTVQLLFNSHLAKTKAEKFISHILQAFETVLRSPVTIEIRCESRKDNPVLPTNNGVPHHNDIIRRLQNRDASSTGANRSEIVEAEASPRGEYKFFNQRDNNANSTHKTSNGNSLPNERKLEETNPNLSIVKRKVSLAHVIQHAEAYSRLNGWSKHKAVSIAEKLERENLKLEARSRRLLCWNPPRLTRRKLSRLKIRTRKSQAIMKFVTCGRCLSARSPSYKVKTQKFQSHQTKQIFSTFPSFIE